MSISALNWAKKAICPGPGAKLILLLLADSANEDDFTCWPSQKRLQAEACMSERAVRDNLTRLEEAGLISRSPRHRENGARRSDLYTLSMRPNRQNPPVAKDTNRQMMPHLPADDAGLEPSIEPSDTFPSERPADAAEAEREFFAEGKKLLGQKAGGLLAKLKSHHGLLEARRLLEMSGPKQDRREWLAATMTARARDPTRAAWASGVTELVAANEAFKRKHGIT